MMMKRLVPFAMVALFLLPAVHGQGEAEKNKPERFSAVAIAVRGPAASRSTYLDFRVDKYTSDEQVEEYLEILAEGGVDELRKSLEKVKVGSVSPTGRVGTDIAVARKRQTEAGTLFTFVTARNMPFFELYRSGRSTDYPFGVFQLLVDDEGKGEGSVIVAAKIRFDKEGRLVIESYGQLDTIRLSNVRRN